MPGLKITLLQQPLVWMDGPANLRHFDRQLEGITGRDLIVLPEMFTTGFAMEAAKQSLSQEEVVAWMEAKADQTNALIAGSAALQTDRGPVNRFFTQRVTSGSFLPGAAGEFCRWYATTCASPCGHATITTTI